MKLWEIVKLVSEEKMLCQGYKWKGINIPINLIIEFDNGSLVYYTLMSDTTSRDPVSLCNGEINTEFERI